MYKILFYLSFTFLCILSCTQEKKLPYIGNFTINGTDTIFTKVPDFELMNQDSIAVNSKSFEGKAYLASFFFTSCPTICPKVMRNMIRLKDQFSSNKQLAYLCFSLDFKRDSIPRIKDYYQKLGIDHANFHILQGHQQNDIRNLVNNYMSIAVDDPDSPGGINHSGWIILVDPEKRMRAYALGTDDQDVDRLMGDVKILLDEMGSH